MSESGPSPEQDPPGEPENDPAGTQSAQPPPSPPGIPASSPEPLYPTPGSDNPAALGFLERLIGRATQSAEALALHVIFLVVLFLLLLGIAVLVQVAHITVTVSAPVAGGVGAVTAIGWFIRSRRNKKE